MIYGRKVTNKQRSSNMEGAIHTQEWKKNNRWFHALARKCGLSKEDIEATIYRAYNGKVSTTELNASQIYSLCKALQNTLSSKELEKASWRRRLIGVVRKYCRKMSYQADDEYVKKIITRGGKNFNEMSKSELIAKYNAFNKMVKELENHV